MFEKRNTEKWSTWKQSNQQTKKKLNNYETKTTVYTFNVIFRRRYHISITINYLSQITLFIDDFFTQCCIRVTLFCQTKTCEKKVEKSIESNSFGVSIRNRNWITKTRVFWLAIRIFLPWSKEKQSKIENEFVMFFLLFYMLNSCKRVNFKVFYVWNIFSQKIIEDA